MAALFTAELTEIQQRLAEIGAEAEDEPMRQHAAVAAALVKMAAQATGWVRERGGCDEGIDGGPNVCADCGAGVPENHRERHRTGCQVAEN